jgi:hypothetical protein
MKKQSVIICVCALLCINKAMAQTYYYNTSKLFNEVGYVYRCNTTSWGSVTLSLATDKYTDYLTFVYANGSPVTDKKILEGDTPLMEEDNWTKQKCMSIVNNAFSGAERTRVKGEKIDVNMIIDPITGKVIEVHFWFLKDDPFATIPVTTYRIIEQNLKSQIWFTPTSIGKQLKFLVVGWIHEVQ